MTYTDYELRMELAYAVEELSRKNNIPVKDLIEMVIKMYEKEGENDKANNER